MTILKVARLTSVFCHPNKHVVWRFKRDLSDKILPTSDYFTWNTANPVRYTFLSIHIFSFEGQIFNHLVFSNKVLYSTFCQGASKIQRPQFKTSKDEPFK